MKPLLIWTFAFFLASCTVEGQKKVFELGTTDKSSAEFALSPDNYEDYLAHDFGWEDRYYIVGYSDTKKDWPYILAGPENGWGGTGPTSGWRTHVLNILFPMKAVSGEGEWKLIIDLLDIDTEKPPLLKVTINGKSWKQYLGELLTGNDTVNYSRKIEIPIKKGSIVTGGNEIQLTILEGSWLTFDNITLEGPARSKIGQVNKKIFVRSVHPATYEVMEGEVAKQPLLVDVEHLSGTPLLSVVVDGNKILEQTLEQKRYILEALMPAATSEQKSTYKILVDGTEVEKGEIIRVSQPQVTPADYVETSLGTAHSRWMIAPGPWMPFSMVKISPDNQNSGWQAGYQPSFESIGTFSHIHEWTMSGLGIMPVNGPLKIKIGDQSSIGDQTDSYRSNIDKSSEETALGCYKVKLTDYDILAELTATTRCSFQRYTYPKGTDSRIMINLRIPAEYGYQILDAEITRIDNRRIEGYSNQHSPGVWYGDVDQDYKVHFVIEFDKEIKKFGGWVNEQLSENKNIKAIKPDEIGCYVEFDTSKDPVVQVRTSISYVDMNGARNNLQKEIAEPFGWSFDAVYQNHRDVWNELLGRIEIYSNDRHEKKRFYTNLYRSFCRNMFSDVDGRWVDATEKIRKFDDPDNVALGCDAFWNTFWNLNQLWNLVTPEWSSRWVKSQLAMYNANGWLAKGPAGMEYIPVMVAEHEIPLLVSAYQMGIRDYDVEKMFSAVKKMQTSNPQKVGRGLAGNLDMEVYLKHKYVPADKGRFSNSLEYSYDDWTVSQLAKALSKEKDYSYFADRGNWWKNVIDTDSGYARLRYSDGSWEKDFDPFKSGANYHYVEGNAWQLTFFVPQDIPGLADIIGKEKLLERLKWGFEQSDLWRYNAPGDQYWDFPVVQGNQQSMHFAFLFNWMGQPWETQKWTRSIMDRYYGYGIADAYLGDEDQGQMSSWFVMAALGLFQTDGGCSVDPVYEIASPLFEKATIRLDKKYGRGDSFTIIAEGASRKRKYVQSAELNGNPVQSFKFPARELLKGGTLKLIMGEEPNKAWGVE